MYAISLGQVRGATRRRLPKLGHCAMDGREVGESIFLEAPHSIVLEIPESRSAEETMVTLTEALNHCHDNLAIPDPWICICLVLKNFLFRNSPYFIIGPLIS